MKRKILKYLNKKNEFNNLDNIFDKYASGELYNKLLDYGYSNIEIIAQLNKREQYVEINFIYQNLAAYIKFDILAVGYCIYPCGCKIEEFEKNYTNLIYENIFDLDEFLKLLNSEINKNPELKNISNQQHKKRKYKIIANLCLIIPISIICILGIYIVLSKSTLKLNPFIVVCFCVMPIIAHVYFDFKSK